jgi:hypothetical protein
MPTPIKDEQHQQLISEQEATVLAKVQEAAKTANNPEDIHAKLFEMYMPIFRRYLEHLSKKALIRLIGALIEVPLNEKEIKSRSKPEQDAFRIGDQLLTSKYVMMILTDAEQAMNAKEEKKQETPPPGDDELAQAVEKSLEEPIPSVIELPEGKGESNG